jgi:prepilin-type N-terminal cleavage/methylation domain-containing protein
MAKPAVCPPKSLQPASEATYHRLPCLALAPCQPNVGGVTFGQAQAFSKTSMRFVKHTLNGRQRQFQRQAGYTLVEVMCSIFIAAIAVTVLFYGFNNGFAILRTTREDLRATQILMQKTEAFRLFTWAQLSNCPATFTEYYNPSGTASNAAGTLYYGKLSTVGVATNIPDSVSYKSNLHLITVTVNWTNYIGKQAVAHSRQMQTLSALAGMQGYLSRASTN